MKVPGVKQQAPNLLQVRQPSSYDKLALAEIHEWKNPSLGWFGYAMRTVAWPFNKAGELVTQIPGVDWVIDKSVGGIVGLLNDAAHFTVRPEAIRDDFRKAGHSVKEQQHIFDLDLEDVGRVIGWLAAKYKGMALVEGAGAGAAGLPGIPVDIVALITMNLRAIGEYATHCGFDISVQHERLFALNVLGLASSPTDAAKQVAMAQLVKIAQDVAKKRAWKELEQHTFVAIIRNISKAIGVRLTKAKLAQIVPAVGAAVGGGFNAYYTSRVTDAAYFLYRERFLAQKYGPDVLTAAVAPASEIQGLDEPV
jgi:hypothetical protein